LTPSSFKLPLAPPNTLGRRFQYAFLSLDPGKARLYPSAGYVEFGSTSDYVELVRRTVQRIARLIRAQGRRGSRASCRVISVTDVSIDCCSLDRGPRLYRAGSRGDYGLLRQLVSAITSASSRGDYGLLRSVDLNLCTRPGKRGEAIAWVHAAISYAVKVLQNNGPLGGKISDLPWLAKATLFSKARLAGPGTQPGLRTAGLTLDSLGTVLLGGAIAYAGAETIGERRETLEFYIIPDTVAEVYITLRDLMIGTGVLDSTLIRAARLAKTFPVSLEAAASLVLAVSIAERYGSLEQLSSAQLAEVEQLDKSALVVTVTPQQRPLVRSAVPLTTALYFQYNSRTLRLMLKVAQQLAQQVMADRELSGAADVVGVCINTLLLHVYSQDASHLAHCIRGLESIAVSLEDKGQYDLASSIYRLIGMLVHDIT